MRASSTSTASAALAVAVAATLAVVVVACDASPALGQAKPIAPLDAVPAGMQVAVVAGGCFWCIEADMEKVSGILLVQSGYAGGPEKNPTYDQVSAGRTGHTESIRIVFDPARISYEKVVETFFHKIDPTQKDGQFCDHGRQYRTAVFPIDDAQKKTAEAVRDRVAKELKVPGPVVTEVTGGATFWPAEVYHQDYWKKEPFVYGSYRTGCGRDARVNTVWGK